MPTITMEQLRKGAGDHQVSVKARNPRRRRTSRAQMKREILWFAANSPDVFTVAEACRAVGRKPSTHIRNILNEMCQDGVLYSYQDERDFHIFPRSLYFATSYGNELNSEYEKEVRNG